MFRCTIAYFIYRITQKILDALWAMLRNGWICIFNCVTWFLTLSYKAEKCLFIQFLSVCPSVCARSFCRKYSWNAFKFMRAVHTWCRMTIIENDMHGTMCSFTETHKVFSIHFGLSGGVVKFVKFLVTYLYCTKYKAIKYLFNYTKECFIYGIIHKISDTLCTIHWNDCICILNSVS